MKFAISAVIVSLAGLAAASVNVPRQSCPQASRFGVLTVSPTTPLKAGDNLNVHVDLSCAVHTFGIVPRFLDYTIVVPAAQNNGHEPPIVVARRQLLPGATSDTFTVKVPHAFYFASAPYQLVFTNTYPVKGTDGSEVLQQGSISAPLSILA